MVCVENPWDFGFTQGIVFNLGLITKIRTELDHDNSPKSEEGFQKRPVEIPKLKLRVFSLGQLDFQQQDIARQQNIDIRLAEIAPSGICISNPLIVVNGIQVSKMPFELTQDSPLIGLPLGTRPFELRLLSGPRVILQNLAASQVLYSMTMIRRLGHWNHLLL
mgnify:CR=1 FL=1